MDRRVLLYKATDPSDDLPQARSGVEWEPAVGRRCQGDADDEEESFLAEVDIVSAPGPRAAFP